MNDLVGRTLLTESGRSLRIVRTVGEGGQGVAYAARNEKTGTLGIYKRFWDPDPDVENRVRWLARERLGQRCEVCCGPIDVVREGPSIGYYMPYAPGVALERATSLTFGQRLHVCRALATGVAALHRLGIVHGDLHGQNALVGEIDGVLRVHLIDLDGAADASHPPKVYGAPGFMSPEARMRFDAKAPPPGDERSERFSLAVLLHESLINVHPAALDDELASDAEELAAFYDEGWRFDVFQGRTPPTLCISPWAVGPLLGSLFRRAFGGTRDERPTAAEWATALIESRVGICLRCGAEQVTEPAATRCINCGEPFPMLGLVDRRQQLLVAFAQDRMELGRSALPGPRVSACHARVERVGPEFVLTPLGRNPTFVWDPAREEWVELGNGVAYSLAPGQILRFADVDAEVSVLV